MTVLFLWYVLAWVAVLICCKELETLTLGTFLIALGLAPLIVVGWLALLGLTLDGPVLWRKR